MTVKGFNDKIQIGRKLDKLQKTTEFLYQPSQGNKTKIFLQSQHERSKWQQKVLEKNKIFVVGQRFTDY